MNITKHYLLIYTTTFLVEETTPMVLLYYSEIIDYYKIKQNKTMMMNDATVKYKIRIRRVTF